jgi:predicted Zn-ribbon and HTH transcriptional regulator
MATKNRYEGLGFRIMETLQDAKGVPLTVEEITNRLHSGQYKDTLKDNLSFQVGMQVRRMRNAGKLEESPARDVKGRVTFLLPQRMMFPKKPDEPAPANPVLTREHANKIVAKEPEPPKEAKRPVYAPGITDKIIDLLDKAPHPLALPEIMAVLGEEYKGTHHKKDLSTLFAGHMLGLFKAHKVRRISSTGRVKMVQYEYLTKKTGKATPPAQAPTIEEPKHPAFDRSVEILREQLHTTALPTPEPTDEASHGFTTLRLLGLAYRVPVTEVLRVADTWARAGYFHNPENKDQ